MTITFCECSTIRDLVESNHYLHQPIEILIDPMKQGLSKNRQRQGAGPGKHERAIPSGDPCPAMKPPKLMKSQKLVLATGPPHEINRLQRNHRRL
ncbi:MAG: hypothetical protein OEV91_11245, partial [Desulfobulbaceae bacterium]|nr:hypothetical protein [Desulfobulbaceae bacterium]